MPPKVPLPNAVRRWLDGVRPRRIDLKADLLAGLPLAISAVPDGMASATLVGVNPAYGLYSAIAGPVVGGLTASTRLMLVTTTSAASLAAGSALVTLPADERDSGLIMLTLLAGGVHGGRGLPAARPLRTLRLPLGDARLPQRGLGQHRPGPDPRPARGVHEPGPEPHQGPRRPAAPGRDQLALGHHRHPGHPPARRPRADPALDRRLARRGRRAERGRHRPGRRLGRAGVRREHDSDRPAAAGPAAPGRSHAQHHPGGALGRGRRARAGRRGGRGRTQRDGRPGGRQPQLHRPGRGQRRRVLHPRHPGRRIGQRNRDEQDGRSPEPVGLRSTPGSGC